MYELFIKNLRAAKMGAILSGTGAGIANLFSRNQRFWIKPADISKSISENFSEGLDEGMPSAALKLMYAGYAVRHGANLRDFVPGMTTGGFLFGISFDICSRVGLPPLEAIFFSSLFIATIMQMCQTSLELHRLEQIEENRAHRP